MIGMFSQPGDLVIDPFAGSGSTLRMAVEMKRRAVGYEIVDSYVQNADKFVEKGISKPKTVMNTDYCSDQLSILFSGLPSCK